MAKFVVPDRIFYPVARRPNWWYRLWWWLLLGLAWEEVDAGKCVGVPNG